MDISLSKLPEKPKFAVAFGVALAVIATLLVSIVPSMRSVLPRGIVNATDFGATILSFLAVLYVLNGVQAWRKMSCSRDSFDTPKETVKAGILCILVAAILFGAAVELGESPKWLWDALGTFSVGFLAVGVLSVVAGLLARRK
jgi:uncharacterized membrane protein